MNYLMLISIFSNLFILPTNNHVILQSQQGDFVDIIPMPEWTFSSGEKKELEIVFIIKDGYHIQADQVLDGNLIPTSVTIQHPDGIIISDALYPPHYSFQLKNVARGMAVFNHNLEIRIPVSINEDIEKGNYLLNGNLHYQVCDSVRCYFPRDLPFEIQIVVE